MRDKALDKNNALFMIYESIKHRVEFSFNDYAKAVNNWNVIPLIENDEVIGGVLLKDNELHVGYGKAPKASIKHYIKSILNSLIDSYGFAITSVKKENKIGLKFCKRLGFFEISQENDLVKLRCDRSNYQ